MGGKFPGTFYASFEDELVTKPRFVLSFVDSLPKTCHVKYFQGFTGYGCELRFELLVIKWPDQGINPTQCECEP